MCKQAGLEHSDLDLMTIGMCIDYIDEFVEWKNPKKGKIREATQADFDKF